MEKQKTIFCDIDGTLWKHEKDITLFHSSKNKLLPNTLDAIRHWEKSGYKIILTTGRKENLRKITEENLNKLGIVYDYLLMGLGSGDRILINDRKEKSSRNTSYSINVIRNKGIQHFDFNTNFVTISDNQPKKVEKPWGGEELIEYNDNYVVKKLFMKKGECCSMQYHELKRETVYVLSGKLKLYIGDNIENLEEKIMFPGEHITIEPYTIHRMEGVEDSYYLESSTNELWDVVRLQDKYKRNIELINREEDIIYGKKDLIPLYTFKKFPIFMGCTEEEENKDKLVDMDFFISNNSGMIQIKNLIPLEILYSESHNSGVVGKTWLEHHKTFSKFIKKFEPSDVLEIGGGNGILSQEYQNLTKDINWTVVDPNPNKNIKNKITGFFGDNFIYKGKIDTVVHSHVFEHVYNPDNFISSINKFLKVGDKLIFSIPNMKKMILKKYGNFLNFEHTYFLSEDYCENILSRNNFFMLNKVYFLEDHSIFYAFEKRDNVNITKLKENLFVTNKELFLNYINHLKSLVEKVNKKLENIEGCQLYLFGAHIFSQIMINIGLKTGNIIGLLDNDKNKNNKRLYGTGLKVYSPKILKNCNNPIVILYCGVYDNEIKDDIIKNINNKTKFI